MRVFFCIITAALLCLMVGADNPEQHKHYAYAFLGALAGTIVAFAIG